MVLPVVTLGMTEASATRAELEGSDASVGEGSSLITPGIGRSFKMVGLYHHLEGLVLHRIGVFGRSAHFGDIDQRD